MSLFRLLNKKQKTRLYLLLSFFLLSAVIQVIGVASIAPFIALLSNPDIIKSNTFFQIIYELSGADSTQQFTIYFAYISLLMIASSNLVNLLTLLFTFKFGVLTGGEIQIALYENFIKRNYIFHKSTNYNGVISTIANEVPRFIYMVLQPFLQLVCNVFIAIFIITGLLYLDSFIAICSATIIGGSYLATYLYVKKSLQIHGKRITERNDQVQKILSESFIGIKDIKLNATEKQYIDRLNVVNFRGLDSAATISIYGDTPKFVIETISFCAILFLAIGLLKQSDAPGEVMSILSVYALAGYKLLPTVQQIYKSISAMSANGSVIHDLIKEINHATSTPSAGDSEQISNIEQIGLTQVSYYYPNKSEPALNEINIVFKRGELNTIAGPSGSGKSTLADILLGLLYPQSGILIADQEQITEKKLLSYQKSIGYVPQSIFILDDSIVSNVAFGVSPENVDIDKVKRALIQANAMEFVEHMADGVYTQLGQDGKMLSGGQRQRIGIARALYKDGTILILDEPTSALDIQSEFEIMQLLNKLKNEILIIVISHRPAAIKLSDCITILENGEVTASGSYDELIAKNQHFRELIEKGMMG
jgi:ATP-binding cassette, subfamily B, bacterial PglK